jgi:hypothetical protein
MGPMMASDQPPATPKKVRDGVPTTADIIPIRQREIPAERPADLSRADALKVIRTLADDTAKIVVIPYGRKKAGRRGITRRQIELCVQKGTPTEGPFLNQHGNWQMNLYRHAAGEQITCVVAIDWPTQVLVINAF